MSFADNADIIRALFEEGWNRGYFENLQGLVHEDAVLHIGSMSRPTNLDDLEVIATRWRSAFDDFGSRYTRSCRNGMPWPRG